MRIPLTSTHIYASNPDNNIEQALEEASDDFKSRLTTNGPSKILPWLFVGEKSRLRALQLLQRNAVVAPIPEQQNEDVTATAESSTPAQNTFLSDLPHELESQILTYLNTPSWNKIRQTNQHWAAVGANQIKKVTVLKRADLARALTTFTKVGLELTLIGKAFTDQDLQHLPQSIRGLHLKWCHGITNVGLSHLKESTLKSMSLESCYGITNGCLKGLPRALEKFKFFDCYKITDADLANLPPQLKEFFLTQCNKITDTGLQHLRHLGMKLIHLHINGAGITETGLAYLKGMPLRHLSLNGCAITDAELAQLTEMPLRRLSLNGCSQFTNGGLVLLPRTLEALSLKGCNQITDTGLENIKDLQLQELNISACNKVTDRGLGHLWKMPLKRLNFVASGHRISDAALAQFPQSVVILHQRAINRLGHT